MKCASVHLQPISKYRVTAPCPHCHDHSCSSSWYFLLETQSAETQQQSVCVCVKRQGHTFWFGGHNWLVQVGLTLFQSGLVGPDSQGVKSYSVWCYVILIICFLIQLLSVFVIKIFSNIFKVAMDSKFNQHDLLKLSNRQWIMFVSVC